MYGGIDIGSRTVELVLLDEKGDISIKEMVDSSYNPIERARDIVSDNEIKHLVATGYGRYRAQAGFADEVISEIKAYSISATHHYPKARSVLDIGGQDIKAISLSDGDVIDFVLNDKCAAGTGVFLERVADSLDLDIEELSQLALEYEGASVELSSKCAVFAESEVISLLHSGASRKSVAQAVHDSVVNIVLGQIRKLEIQGPMVFGGGVAHNRYIQKELESELNYKVLTPEYPELMGAHGAALHAYQKTKSR